MSFTTNINNKCKRIEGIYKKPKKRVPTLWKKRILKPWRVLNYRVLFEEVYLKKSSLVSLAKIIVLMSGGWINICHLTQEKHRIIKKIMILTVNIRVSYGKICTPCFALFSVVLFFFFFPFLEIKIFFHCTKTWNSLFQQKHVYKLTTDDNGNQLLREYSVRSKT